MSQFSIPSSLTNNLLSQPGKSVSMKETIQRFMIASAKLRQGANVYETKVANFLLSFKNELKKDHAIKCLQQTAETDRYDAFSDFVVMVFDLLAFGVVKDVSDRDVIWMKILESTFQCLEDTTMCCAAFVKLYNVINRETEKCSTSRLYEWLQLVSKRISDECLVSKRWSDTLVILFIRLREANSVLMPNGETVSGKVLVYNTLLDWLKRAHVTYIFPRVVAIIKSLDMALMLEAFAQQCLQQNVLESSERPFVSRKLLHIIEIVDSKKCVQPIIRALCTCWPFVADDDSCGNMLLSVLNDMFVKMDMSAEVSRVLLSLFKTDRRLVLSSEFGFISMIVLCGIHRHKVAALTEIKRAFQKLYSFKDDCKMNAWLSLQTEGNAIFIDVDAQINRLLLRLEMKDWHNLTNGPLLTLAKTLLDCPSCKNGVIIVDGRVGDASQLALLAHSMLKGISLNYPKSNFAELLNNLVDCVSAAQSTGLATIYIDVLYETMIKRPVDVLNEYKQLESLFQYVCRKKRDIAVPLVRCLLPIVNHRPDLRLLLFESLKKDLICDSTTASAVPILLMLLRSVSRRNSPSTRENQSQCSQSFATFSTQCLNGMNLSRTNDEKMGLELIGALKRCLCQPFATKIALYQGMVEVASTTASIVVPCFEMLITQAAKAPSWKPEEAVLATKSLTELREPIPQLMQAIEMMSVIAMNLENTDEIGALLDRSTAYLEANVKDLAQKDLIDLSIDKYTEWNPGSTTGRSNLLFARMIVSTYDVLIEHLWRRSKLTPSTENKDLLVAILKRRRELVQLLESKLVKRKEAKSSTAKHDGSTTLKMSDAQVLINPRTVVQILQHFLKSSLTEEEEDVFIDVRMDLIRWALDRGYELSHSLATSEHALHSLLNRTKPLVEMAEQVLTLYLCPDIAPWLNLDVDSIEKTHAVETYSFVVRFLSSKCRTRPAVLRNIWDSLDKKDLSASAPSQIRNTLAGSIYRHINMVFRRFLKIMRKWKEMNEAADEKRKGALEMEKQIKAFTSAFDSLLSVEPTMFSSLSSSLMKILVNFDYEQNSVLRDILRFTEGVVIRSRQRTQEISKFWNDMADDLLEVLSEDGDASTFKMMALGNYTVYCDAVINVAERMLNACKCLMLFANDLYMKDGQLDAVCSHVFQRLEEISEIISQMLQLHKQFNEQKEKVTRLLTTYFLTIDVPVKMMLDNVKTIPNLKSWKSISTLSSFMKKKLRSIMAIADENVGIFTKEDAVKASKMKSQCAKMKRDETLYVRYVRARESCQARVLLLSKAIDDDRLILIIKNNSIGFRDFKLDEKLILQRMAAMDQREDVDSESADDTRNAANETPTIRQPPAKRQRVQKQKETHEGDAPAKKRQKEVKAEEPSQEVENIAPAENDVEI